MSKPAKMQTWEPLQYAQHGRFVADLAGGVVELLSPRPGERILDLGCGDGAVTAQLVAAGAAVTGVDASEQMVHAAKAAGIDARWVAAEKLPFAGEFDAVFSNAALHWISDQDAMLSGVYRALKAGGRFVAEMGGHGNIAAIEVALKVALQSICQRPGLDADSTTPNYFPTARAYGQRLQHRGFVVEQIALISRPTLLPPSGMRGWLQTFRRGLLDQLTPEEREAVITEALALLQPVLCDELGQWTADYVRLRFRAYTQRF